MRVLSVALVGAGHMGRHHARVVSQNPRSRLVAVCDRFAPAAAVLADRWGAEAVDTVPAGVDAVIVATPAATHADLAAAALARGQWVLVEKPAVLAAAELVALRSERLVVAQSERFNPAVRAAGGLRPSRVLARRLVAAPPRDPNLHPVLDLMVHDLDLALAWGVGPVVACHAVWRCTDTLTAVLARLRTADGLTAELLAGYTTGALERVVHLVDTSGPVTLDLAAGRASRAGRLLPPPEGGDALEAQWEAFLGAALDGAVPAVGWADASRTHAAADLMLAVLPPKP